MATLVEIIGKQQIRIVAQEQEIAGLKELNAGLQTQLEKLQPRPVTLETQEPPVEVVPSDSDAGSRSA